MSLLTHVYSTYRYDLPLLDTHVEKKKIKTKNLTKFILLRFLLQCLEDLDSNLRRLNSRLFVIRGQPADTLPKLFKEWGTTCLTFEEDPEPFGRVRDHNITEICKELSVEVITAVSHTLYKLEKYWFFYGS